MYSKDLISTLVKIIRSSNPGLTYKNFVDWGKLQYSNDDILRHLDNIKEGETPDHIKNCEKIRAFVLGSGAISPSHAETSKLTYKSIMVALQVIGEHEFSETGKRIIRKYRPKIDERSDEAKMKRKKRIDEAKRRLGRDLEKYFTPDKKKGNRHDGAKKAILNEAINLLSAEINSGQFKDISNKIERGKKRLETLLQGFTHNNP